MTDVLIIGNGGREAAIAHSLLKNSSVRVHVTPTLHGLKNIIHCPISYDNFSDLLSYIQKNSISLVIIGPEQPLMNGLSDQLRAHNVLVFGPSQKGAQLEYSKIFCKEFLSDAQIPTAHFHEVTSIQDILNLKNNFSSPWILKVDGLAAGKGVFICSSEKELLDAGKIIFEELRFGKQRAFFENFISGTELSYMVLTNGQQAQTLPIAQDHKRVFDEDIGPNTGGMGAVAPLKISKTLEEKIQSNIVAPFLKELQKRNIMYRGVVYFGLMIDSKEEPYVLEINARFGDPEAQAILPLIKTPLFDVFLQIAKGELLPLEYFNEHSICLVLASPGYPDSPEVHLPITAPLSSDKITSNTYFLPAGISVSKSNSYETRGGRVLNIVSKNSSARECLTSAYLLAQEFSWKGIHYRKDIGQKVLFENEFLFQPDTSKDIKIRTLNKKERILNATKAFGVFLALSLASIAIPLLHFILVPSLFIFGVYWGIHSYSFMYAVKTSKHCMGCKKPLNSEYLCNEQMVVRCRRCLFPNKL